MDISKALKIMEAIKEIDTVISGLINIELLKKYRNKRALLKARLSDEIYRTNKPGE
jgi:hypothetical protein